MKRGAPTKNDIVNKSIDYHSFTFAERIMLEVSVIRGSRVAYEVYQRLCGATEAEVEIGKKRKHGEELISKPKYTRYRNDFVNTLSFDFFKRYCRKNGITTKDLISKDESTAPSAEEVRTTKFEELENLIDKAENPVHKAQIIKQQIELMGAKIKSDEEPASAASKYVHYFLPACMDTILDAVREKSQFHYDLLIKALGVFSEEEEGNEEKLNEVISDHLKEEEHDTEGDD